MADIVVIGSASIDYTVTAPNLPRPGETVLGNRFFQVCGGKGANQAVGCARLGGRVAMVARVGDDLAGRTILSALREAGIETAHVAVDATAASGTAHITVDEQGHNSIVVIPGANALLSRADIDQARPLIAGAKLVMIQLEIPLDTALYAVQVAREYGIQLMLDPAPAPAAPLPDDFYRHSTIATPNETEAEALCGFAVDSLAMAERAARLLRSRGIAMPIVKLGERGAVYLDGDQLHHVPAFAVETVDTTAAGDSFAAGLAVALVEGQPPLLALRFAAATGALATTQYGAQSSLPSRADVERLLEA